MGTYRVVHRTRRAAFTLVEILIVVVILGILAMIVVPKLSNATDTANRSSLAKDLQTVRGQLEVYKLQHGGSYPTLADFAQQMTGKTNAAGAVGTDYGPYLATVPDNPFTRGNTLSAPNGAGDWWYSQSSGSFTARAPNDGI